MTGPQVIVVTTPVYFRAEATPEPEPQPVPMLKACPLGLSHPVPQDQSLQNEIVTLQETVDQLDRVKQHTLTAGEGIYIDEDDWIISADIPEPSVPTVVTEDSVTAPALDPGSGSHTIEIVSLADVRDYQGYSNITYNKFQDQVYKQVNVLNTSGKGIKHLMGYNNNASHSTLYSMYLGGKAKAKPNEFGNLWHLPLLPSSQTEWSDFYGGSYNSLMSGWARHRAWGSAQVTLSDATTATLYARFTSEMTDGIRNYTRNSGGPVKEEVEVWVKMDRAPVEADITALVGQEISVTIDPTYHDYTCNFELMLY